MSRSAGNIVGALSSKGTVVYIACEGERGLAARNAAFWQKHLNGEDDPPFYLLTTRLDLPAQINQLGIDLVAQIPAGTAVGAIVLDTLNRSIGGSESKDEDMAAYVTAADMLREYFKCAVIVIHHCGIDATRPRGHTSLTGAVDAQLAIKRGGDDQITTYVEWLKDGPEGDSFWSRLETIEVGRDENDMPITSCVVIDAEGRPTKNTKRIKLSPKQQIALDALIRAVAADGKPAPGHNHIPSSAIVVSEELWRRFYMATTSSDGQDENTRRKAFRDARDALMSKGCIQMFNDLVYVV
jgi:hypothetical protein